MKREVMVVSWSDSVSWYVLLEKLKTNRSCTHICIEILKNNKLHENMIQ
jgi:hypothetical protein